MPRSAGMESKPQLPITYTPLAEASEWYSSCIRSRNYQYSHTGRNKASSSHWRRCESNPCDLLSDLRLATDVQVVSSVCNAGFDHRFSIEPVLRRQSQPQLKVMMIFVLICLNRHCSWYLQAQRSSEPPGLVDTWRPATPPQKHQPK